MSGRTAAWRMKWIYSEYWRWSGDLLCFLYGMQVLGDGLKRTSGGRLEEILESLTSNKWKGALLGCIVTAVIQSSSATTVMVVGLVNSGIMKLAQAAGVILGANVGTTVTSWMLSLDWYRKQQCVCTAVKAGELLTNRRYHWRDHADDR